MKKLHIIALGCLALAQAQLVANTDKPIWEYFDLAYVNSESSVVGLNGDTLDPTGLRVGLSVYIDENLLLLANGNFSSADSTGLEADLDTMNLGVGYVFGLTGNTEFVVGLSLEAVELCAAALGQNQCIDEDGFGVMGGVKSRLHEKFELGGYAKYIDIDEVDMELNVEGNYFFTEDFMMGLFYTDNDLAESVGLHARFAF